MQAPFLCRYAAPRPGVLLRLLTLVLAAASVVTTASVERAAAAEPKTYFAYRSFWPEHETMKRFASVGVHTYCVFPGNTENSLGEPYSAYPRVWRYPDTYDWDSLYRQFDEIIAFDPDARFLCMVDLNSPIWLTRMLAQHGDGSFDSFIDLTSCLASPQWLAATRQYLIDFLAQTEERYGTRIDAYVLACGQTDEWMDYSAERPSRAKVTAYAKWRESRGLPAAEWPSFDRFDAAALENRIRDPKTEQDVVDAQEFCQELVADSIIDFAKLAKEHISDGKEIGVFFGYILELTDWRAHGCGHLAYEKVFQSDYVDFFISPGTYSERVIGGGSGSMAPNETIRLAGKRRLHETDHRTTTYNCALNEFVGIPPIARWENEDQDVAGLRREMCLALVDHASIWFFDMWGGSFKSERAIENVGIMKRVWNRNIDKQGGPAAEILLVTDPQSARRVNDREPTSPFVYHAVRNRLNHIGAPFAVCSFNDLQTEDLSRIKLAILPGSFYLSPERRAILRDTLLRDGRTVLWIGPAGVDDGASLDLDRVRETTGAEYAPTNAELVPRAERSGFFGEGDGKWFSAAIGAQNTVTSEQLRRLAKEAGASLYVEDDSPVYASENLVAVHAKDPGVKRVTLPRKASRVTEAFSGKVVAEDADAFDYDFAGPETALFELEF